jgi:hypothetical protein
MSLQAPTALIRHVVRGLLDGDGSVDCYVHKPIKSVDSSYLYQRLGVRFNSASRAHLEWLRRVLAEALGIKGALRVNRNDPPRHDLHVLKYGKYASIILLTWLYVDSMGMRLERKFRQWSGFLERERSGFVLYRRVGTQAKTLRAIADADRRTLKLIEKPE